MPGLQSIKTAAAPIIAHNPPSIAAIATIPVTPNPPSDLLAQFALEKLQIVPDDKVNGNLNGNLNEINEIVGNEDEDDGGDVVTDLEVIGGMAKGLGKPKKSNPHSVSRHVANKLHEVISTWYPNSSGKITAGKLTGMFLQNHDEDKVMKYLSRQDRLKKKIDAFVKLLSSSE
eukprot:UN00469